MYKTYYSGTQNIMVSDELLWCQMKNYKDDELNFRDDELNYGYAINCLPSSSSYYYYYLQRQEPQPQVRPQLPAALHQPLASDLLPELPGAPPAAHPHEAGRQGVAARLPGRGARAQRWVICEFVIKTD